MDRKLTPDSPATARARRVLPVPGGPTRSTPLGTFAPISLNRLGSRRKSTISCSSAFSSAAPATSSKVTVFPAEPRLALALVKSDTPLLPPLALALALTNTQMMTSARPARK